MSVGVYMMHIGNIGEKNACGVRRLDRANVLLFYIFSGDGRLLT